MFLVRCPTWPDNMEMKGPYWNPQGICPPTGVTLSGSEAGTNPHNGRSFWH